MRALAAADADKGGADEADSGSSKTVASDGGSGGVEPEAPAPALVGVDARSLFVAAEVHPLRPKVVALYNAGKRLAAVHDTDNVVLYQVDHHHASCGDEGAGDGDGAVEGDKGGEQGEEEPAPVPATPSAGALLQGAVMDVLHSVTQPLALAAGALGQANDDVPPPPPPTSPPPPPLPATFGRGGIVDPASLPATPAAMPDTIAEASSSSTSTDAAPETVRVVMTQRRVRRTDGGGVETFRPESFGTPVVAVVPAGISGAALYELAQERFGRFLKPLAPAAYPAADAPASGHDHGAAQEAGGREGSMYSTLRRISRCAAAPALAPAPPTAAAFVSASAAAAAAASDVCAGEVRPLSTEDAMAGALPPRGFCLRLVTGGSLQGDSCSRCPWLARCQGCLVPDSAAPSAAPQLRDGETVAVDWHMVVYEELVDPAAAADVRRHASAVDAEADAAGHAGAGAGRGAVPLSWCLDKFTEGEALDDSVCARCRSPDGQPPMSQRLALWRTPPVLVVHLKRFHFDRHSRRKLNTKVDFPREGLDLTPYLAPARRQQLRRQHNGGGDGGDSGAEAGPADASCLYDLYAVVHHAGAMGGGHYVTTVRDRHTGSAVVAPASRTSSASDLASAAASPAPPQSPSPSPGDAPSSPPPVPPAPGGQWWCFNDDAVTAVADPAEVGASSAYVLFYMRRDVWGKEGDEIFALATGHAAVPLSVPMPVSVPVERIKSESNEAAPDLLKGDDAGAAVTPTKSAGRGPGLGPGSADKDRRSPGGSGLRRPPRIGLPRAGGGSADDGNCVLA